MALRVVNLKLASIDLVNRLGFTTTEKGKKERNENGKALKCLWVMREDDACLFVGSRLT